ncbi:MAG: DUF2510 domain-containing protein [Microcella sp.]|uniref:DUF2510 domain-containing protein n=1 Tax=Microcella sp. TaxID=1913979 RepID=UPI003315AFE6
MTEGSELPVAGWYDDPEIALRLRWWDGSRWSQHTRPKPITQSAPAAPGLPHAAFGAPGETAVAAPQTDAPYSFSAPFSATPTSAPATAGEGVAVEPTRRARFGTRSTANAERPNSPQQSLDYAPERTTTISAWLLAATPLVAFLAQLAVTVLTGLESTPWFWVVGAALLPILWIIIFVRRDRERLHEWGHLERASAWWALLGSYGYLTARGIVVQRQARGGWGPLVLTLLLTAALVSLGIFTPALLLVFLTPLQ